MSLHIRLNLTQTHIRRNYSTRLAWLERSLYLNFIKFFINYSNKGSKMWWITLVVCAEFALLVKDFDICAPCG